MIVGPGAVAPAGFGDGDRVIIDRRVIDHPKVTLDQLQERWCAGQASVIELQVPLDAPAETEDGPVWGLTPEFDFALERLHHLVWAHAQDLRPESSSEPPQGLPDGKAGADGSVALPDGTFVWVDGGPLAPPASNESAVVPWISAERHEFASLRPATSTASLADDQLQAVQHTGGAARIIAPAGSGKTRVLTERARLVVSEWGVPASAVCMVAFNTRAADEMRERLADLPGLNIRTLNSLGLAIVQGTGPYAAHGAGADGAPTQQRVGVLDEPTVRNILGEIVEFPRRTNTDPAAAWLEALTQVRLGLRSPRSVEADYHGDVDGFAEAFDRYRDEIARRGMVDFDEQIYRAIELLLRNPAIRHAAQRASRVLLVDEFQDLTPAHLLLIRLLASPRYDVFGVGDDDQTIYGYTGADPRWLIDYDQFFPGSGSHALQVNYRCPPEVVEAADCLLTHNQRRVAKEIRFPPERTREPDALTVARVEVPDLLAIEHIERLIDDGVPLTDIAVLTRVNSLLAAAQVGLAEAGIPTTAPLGPQFLERTGVRSALAWLFVALHPNKLSTRELRETARRPSRGLAPKVIDWMCEQSSIEGVARLAGRLQDRDAVKLDGWVADARRLSSGASRKSTADLIERIRSAGLGRAIDTLDQARRTVDRASHHDDLDALAALGALHPDPATFAVWLRDRLSAPAPTAGGGDAVQLSTIHRVKGREWPHVIVLHASDGVLPHRLALDREEERRIFHVAVTRGATSVTVVASRERPSPFLDELTQRWTAPVDEPPASPAERHLTLVEATPTKRPKKREGATIEPAAVGLEFDQGGYTMTVVSIEADGVIATTPGGRARESILFGCEIRIDGRYRTLGPPIAGPATGGAAGPGGEGGGSEVRERLREWRRATAAREGIPAYRVFADTTLDDIVLRLPGSYDELLACQGIGPTKLERYGDDILAVLAE